MRNKKQVFWGILTAIFFILLLLGIFSLSLAEGNLRPQTSAQQTTNAPPTISPTRQPIPSLLFTFTPLPTIWTPTCTSTLSGTTTGCTSPIGWVPYTIQPGDTLEGLAQRYNKSAAEISQANCLLGTSLVPGVIIYLPPVPTFTPIRCGTPSNWVLYWVQPGDTLYHLGEVFGINWLEIQRANCLTSSTIHVGQILYVPPWATHTPWPTIPGVPTATETPTWTFTPETPVETWTETPTPTESETPTETNTPVETETPTPTPTDTPG